MVLRSCYEFHTRDTEPGYKTPSKLSDGEFTRDVCHLIHEIGQKKYGFPCYEVDLLRDFLHGIAFLSFEEAKNNFEPSNKTGKANIENGNLWFDVHLDNRCRNAYQAYLRGDKSYTFYQKGGATGQVDVNTNREWDYVEVILGHIETELSRLDSLRNAAKTNNC